MVLSVRFRIWMAAAGIRHFVNHKYYHRLAGTRLGVEQGVQYPGAALFRGWHFWSKEGIANVFSRMRGVQYPGAALFRGWHFWSKEGIANVFSRMNLKLDLRFRFWLRLDLPYVWPGLSRFKRLSRCPVPVGKISRNFTSVKFSKFIPA